MDMYEYYEKLTGGALSGYISELTLKGHSDNEIAMLLGVRWSYLFSGLGWFLWLLICFLFIILKVMFVFHYTKYNT